MAVSAGKKLKKYLTRNNMTETTFAKKVGVSQATIWNICDNNRPTRHTVAYKIEAFTGGEIDAGELCTFIKEKREK